MNSSESSFLFKININNKLQLEAINRILHKTIKTYFDFLEHFHKPDYPLVE